MRRVPWRLSLSFDRKAAMTVAGVAMAVAFSLASFSVAYGLQRGALLLDAEHAPDSWLVGDPAARPLRWAEFASLPGALGVVTASGVTDTGRQVMLVAIVGADAPAAAPGTARPGGGEMGDVRALVAAGASLEVRDPLAHPLVPPGWYLVPPELLDAGAPDVDYLSLPGDARLTVAQLRSQGLEAMPSPALDGFFRASGEEIARDLLLVVLLSSLLAALFVYELLRSEVRARRREIGIWRAIGMRRRDVAAVFLARSAALGVAALLVGALLAGVALHAAALRSGRPLGLSLDVRDAATLAASFLAATVAGGVAPARAAARIQVQAALEAEP